MEKTDYLRFENVDKYAQSFFGRGFVDTAQLTDTVPSDVREAFAFIRRFEEYDKFSQKNFEVGFLAALDLLTSYESDGDSYLEAERSRKKKDGDTRRAIIEKAPDIWKDELEPAFDVLISELERVAALQQFNFAYLGKNVLDRKMAELIRVSEYKCPKIYR